MLPRAIGRIGGGHKRATGLLDVAVIQSLVRKGVVKDCVAEYGQVIVDECHHLSARSFEEVVRRAKARFVLGLSATVTRKDGHHPIIFMQCGPVRHAVNAKAQAAARPFRHVVLVRPTAFRPLRQADPDLRMQFQSLYSELIADDQRNRLICDEVVQVVREGRSPLVLTERNEHLDDLAGRLAPLVRSLVVLRGGTGLKAARGIAARLASIPEDEERVLLATGRYIGEGFDDARLDTLFLTLPVSWRGTIAQYAGRLHRLNDRKREVRVYDYADLNVPMLARMFDRRCRGYEAVGYTMLLPASAVPGWPAEVPLPLDPQWKKDYAASVRRLVRDGVDAPLAGLFVHVAREPAPDAEGAGRAQSATEAFLYRRLETLEATRGRFRLNAALPIPFDGWGQIEIDLLGEDTRLAIEIDGGQHLADADAYRRDRRKDQVLQENGYFVLRFLAEDVGKNLDLVLDGILRAWRTASGKQMLLPEAIGIDDQFDPPVPLFAFQSAVGNHRVVRAVADDEKLLGPIALAVDQHVVDGQSPSGGKLVVRAVLPAGDRITVGVAFDSHTLVGIGAADLDGHVGNHVRGRRTDAGAARFEELIARQLDANHVAIAADVDVWIADDGQRLQKAVVGRDRHARLTPQAGREGLGLGVDFLLLALDLGQLGRRAAELLGDSGQAVLEQFALLLLLGQEGLGALVVTRQRVNARLIQFVLLLQGGLLLLVLGHAALQHHRIVGTAGQNDQPQGHRSRRPRPAWHGRRSPSNPPQIASGRHPLCIHRLLQKRG